MALSSVGTLTESLPVLSKQMWLRMKPGVNGIEVEGRQNKTMCLVPSPRKERLKQSDAQSERKTNHLHSLRVRRGGGRVAAVWRREVTAVFPWMSESSGAWSGGLGGFVVRITVAIVFVYF